MKATLIVLVALAVIAVSARARPAESLPQDAQEVVGQVPELPQQVEESSVQERVRRSPKDKGKNRGSVSGGVHREPGVGTVVQAQGQGNIWTSKDGNGRVDAHGQWSKVVDGPGRGKPNYSGGITYTHRF